MWIVWTMTLRFSNYYVQRIVEACVGVYITETF
uniref:Uncharacterized protein n=1 Tax=Anguilla anguilla TaxID=7936 RepID=A0A0E9PN40_ANGAN